MQIDGYSLDAQKTKMKAFCDYNGYEIAGKSGKSIEGREQPAHKYVAIHIDRPFDNPFVTIPGAYHTLFDFMRTNGLERVENGVIPCFETDGESMDVYIACK
jgi:hypothetical protein